MSRLVNFIEIILELKKNNNYSRVSVEEKHVVFSCPVLLLLIIFLKESCFPFPSRATHTPVPKTSSQRVNRTPSSNSSFRLQLFCYLEAQISPIHSTNMRNLCRSLFSCAVGFFFCLYKLPQFLEVIRGR